MLDYERKFYLAYFLRGGRQLVADGVHCTLLGTKYLMEDETHILCTVDGVRKIVSLLNVTTLVLRNNKHERYAVYYDAVNVDIKVIDKRDTRNVWYASKASGVPARKVYAVFSMLPYYITDILFKHHTAICTFHNAYMYSKEHKHDNV